MAKSKVEISKVSVKIGEQAIELTLEQAKELRDILNDTFGEKVVVRPYSPIIIDRPYPYVYPHWTVYATSVSNEPSTSWSISNNTTLDTSSVLGIYLNGQ